MFASQQFGFVPDIMTMAKGLSSGYAPIAAAIVRDSIHDVFKENKETPMGHLITFGSLLLLAGRLGDLFGRKRVFLAGVASFVIASVLCGLAPSGTALVVARFLQGAAAALTSAVIIAIPEVVAYLCLQRYFERGLAAGAIK